MRRPTLVVDVAAVGFCDCAGVRELNAAARRTRAEGGEFRLLGADESLRRVCELAGARDMLAPCLPPDPADLIRGSAVTGTPDPLDS
ncbi:STAS domain-containing protein [Actinospica robiniae]|uniref:STAS domain-containing protein n=1 Tax=Actinospica robiniae TaxID=304901 RepID=UPI0003FF2D11|nr:STAS domain-containing protein [Actinospica robiniae]